MKVCKKRKQLLSAAAFFIVCVSALTYAGAEGRMLVPGGNTVGIELETEGIVVCGLCGVETESGESFPAREAGIRPGDILVRINREPILSAEDLRNVMRSCSGETVAVRILRGEETYQFSLTPARSTDGSYELGIWLRDGIAGIGTVTYYDVASGEFGALGHAITDAETGVLLPARGGVISDSEITGIVRGEIGAPGELIGEFDTVIGSISKNCANGVFGSLYDASSQEESETMEAGSSEEIHTGEAVIRTNICGGSPKDYTAEIVKVFEPGQRGRGMLLRVTDERLLSLTGGIVQGMSGSPIIQDGKLIGAVTHVLVNDPSRGYGIFIEDMLNAA